MSRNRYTRVQWTLRMLLFSCNMIMNYLAWNEFRLNIIWLRLDPDCKMCRFGYSFENRLHIWSELGSYFVIIPSLLPSTYPNLFSNISIVLFWKLEKVFYIVYITSIFCIWCTFLDSMCIKPWWHVSFEMNELQN